MTKRRLKNFRHENGLVIYDIEWTDDLPHSITNNNVTTYIATLNCSWWDRFKIIWKCKLKRWLRIK